MQCRIYIYISKQVRCLMSPDRIVHSWSLNMFGSNGLKLMVAQKVALFNAYVQSLGYDGDVSSTMITMIFQDLLAIIKIFYDRYPLIPIVYIHIFPMKYAKIHLYARDVLPLPGPRVKKRSPPASWQTLLQKWCNFRNCSQLCIYIYIAWL